MTRKISLRHRLQYRFDNMMTGGILPIIIFLLLLVTFFTLVITILVIVVHIIEGHSLADSFWLIFMHVIDQGTITGTVDVAPNWGFRLIMLVPTVFGILMVATLVGLITSRIQSLLSDLRRGRSLVLEKNHVVILGWSSKIFSIIHELIKAHANQKHSHIVILAPKDKLEMELEIDQKIKDSHKTKIICRTGNPIDIDDLDIVNHHEAKSIIIISSESNSSDVENIKSILAIVNHPDRKKTPYHIVAEIKTDNNKEIANIIGGDELTLTVSNDIIARIAVQTCLQSGLSIVYNILLDFDGVDIYFHDIQSAYYKSFREILSAYEEIIPIGIQRQNGLMILNPEMDTIIRDGDRIILLAEDDDALPKAKFSSPTIQENCINRAFQKQTISPRNILILGWNAEGVTIIRELDHYVTEGSQVCIMATHIAQIQQELKSLDSPKNLTIRFEEGDITNRKTLNSLHIPSFGQVLILSYSEHMSVQEADAHTLVTLMHLRDIKRSRNAEFTIVSEMLDLKNQNLAEVAQPDDFIISDHVISLIISQLAENKEVKLVFDELFDAQGMEFYLKPVTQYLSQLNQIDFYTVMEAAAQRSEIAIGYRQCAYLNDPKQDYGIVLNPRKSQKINFQPGDKIIVLAEDI
ncbi:MAG: hypothetical protein NW226_16085 [Microscillaceae bacterium]|nr:hypothetical protein [Microscillaceae bacterium]